MELLISLLPFAAMLGIMWLIMIRPQQKQAKMRQQMLDQMQPGNHVITIGGLHGVIDEIRPSDQTVVLDCEGIYLTFNRSAIASVKEAVKTDQTELLSDEKLVTEGSSN